MFVQALQQGHGTGDGFGLFLGGFVEGLLQALALVLVRLALQQEALCLGEGQQTGVAEVFGRAMRMAAQQRQDRVRAPKSTRPPESPKSRAVKRGSWSELGMRKASGKWSRPA